ncbi:helix-turn-helix domain-containing protein [Intestinimonas butyriciproducens]|uniref:helix-turn-helix domain-containing protein n=1 Tax=Intestinimonas butyriciproducens TaxID=1297617 RepID=UPI0023DF13FF|nr:helix-turn-helix transcriptional regulator [Intestinimonas butyriciproducens]
MDDELRTVGGRIKWVRRQQNLKIKDFASLLGISANYLSLLEHNNRQPSEELLRKMADYADTSYEWMKTGSALVVDNYEIPDTVQEQPKQARDNRAPNIRLCLCLLKIYCPNLFPDTVCGILGITPEKLDGLMDGTEKYRPGWDKTFEVLAGHLQKTEAEQDAGCLFRAVNEFSRQNERRLFKSFVEDYLDAHVDSTYRRGDVEEPAPDGEPYELPDCTVAVYSAGSVCFPAGARDETEHWRFRYMCITSNPDHIQSGKLTGTDLRRYQDVARSLLPKVKPGPKKKEPAQSRHDILIFDNKALYERFAACMAAIQADRESRGDRLAAQQLPTLLLVDLEGDRLLNTQGALPRFAFTTMRDHAAECLGGKPDVLGMPEPLTLATPTLWGYKFCFLRSKANQEEPMLYFANYLDMAETDTAEMPDKETVTTLLKEAVDSLQVFDSYSSYFFVFRNQALYQTVLKYAHELVAEDSFNNECGHKMNDLQFLLLNQDCTAVQETSGSSVPARP